MNTHARLSVTGLGAALAALLVAGAFGGPLDTSRVPADAAWVVHFDAEAALRSSIATACMGAKSGLPLDAFDGLVHWKQEFGIDPLNDIKDATVFGVGPDGADAVAIVTTTCAVDGAIEKLRTKGHDYARVVEGAYELYAWTDDGRTQYGLVRTIGADRRLVYLSKDKGRLTAAVDVAAGHGESLKGRKGSALAADPGPGAILFVASDVMPRSTDGDEGPSMVLGKAKALRLEMGEAGENLYADLDLTMTSSEDATNVLQVLQGIKAMGRMFCQGNPDLSPLRELLDAGSLSAKEATIGAHLVYPAAKLVEALRAAEDEQHHGDLPRTKGDQNKDGEPGKHGHGKKPN